MYPVSEKFLEEIIKPQRIVEITGYIQTEEGTEYTLSNDNVITNSLTVTDQFTGGSFCIGSVYARNITIKLLGFQDVDTRNMSNARIVPIFRLRYSDTEYEDVPLGIFFIDGSQTKRKFNAVTLAATDKMQNFDREAQPLENVSLYQAVSQACLACDVTLGTSEEAFADFPNGDTLVSFTTGQIQTWRDMLMWIADLTGTFCRISRSGFLEFVQMKAETGSDGRIIPVVEIPGDIRFSTDFSDTTVRVPKLIMTRNGNTLAGTATRIIYNRAVMFATMELDENPIIEDKTDEEVKGYLKKLAQHINTLLHRPFETSFNGNPALDAGDYVRLRGGAIDISQSYATGIITYSQWKFRGKHTIKCKSYTSTVRPSDFSVMRLTENTPVTLSEEESDEETSLDIMRKPKSQIEKRIDEVESKLKEGIVSTEKLQTTGSQYYAVTKGTDAAGEDIDGLILSNGKTELQILDKSTPSSDKLYSAGWEIRDKSGLCFIRAFGDVYNSGIKSGTQIHAGSSDITLDSVDGLNISAIYKNDNDIDEYASITIDKNGIVLSLNNGSRIEIHPDFLKVYSKHTEAVLSSDTFWVSVANSVMELKSDGLYVGNKKVLTE